MKTDVKAHGIGKNTAFYRYDQLNRLVKVESQAFNTKYEYDANGNIKKIGTLELNPTDLLFL